MNTIVPRRPSGRNEPTRGLLAPGLRVYAVGDIHGRLDLLLTLIARIHADAASLQRGGRCRVVFLGDYIDRGSQTKAVIECLLSNPFPEFETNFIRGNHEATMINFLDDLMAGPGWLTYGGINTLLSYKVRPPVDVPPRQRLAMVQAQLRDILPSTHLAFLRGLAPYVVIGTYLFVHAGIRPGVALADQSVDDLVWIRDAFLHSSHDHGVVVVHGHTIAMEAESLPNRIGVDTGAYATGRLTAAVLEGETRRFIDTAP
ncbi:MAG: metallophosphoesterase family protein [Rhodospirillaceae bacterium]